MDKIPTAEEFFKSTIPKYQSVSEFMTDGDIFYQAREFAKLHVKAALEAIYEKGLNELTTWDGNPFTGEGSDYLNEDKILNAYPETNIK